MKFFLKSFFIYGLISLSSLYGPTKVYAQVSTQALSCLSCFNIVEKTILTRAGHVAEVWKIQFNTNTPPRARHLMAHQNAVRDFFGHGITTRNLIQRQGEIYRRHVSEESARPYDDVSQGRVGHIGENLSCLEVQILEDFLSRIPEAIPEREFLAYVFQRGNEGVILFSIMPSLAGGAMLPGQLRMIPELIAQGFSFKLNLHNHPFAIERPRDDEAYDWGGASFPSDPDVRMYLNQRNLFQLEAARVTNGFGHLHIPATEFSLMEAWL